MNAILVSHVAGRRTGLSDDSQWLKSKIAEALAHGSSRNYRAAYAILDEALAKWPGHVDALRTKGNILDMEAFLEISEDEDPDPADPRFAEASRLYEEALRQDPNDTLTLVDAAESRARNGDVESSMSAFEHAIHLLKEPSIDIDAVDELVNAHRSRLHVLIDCGRIEDARIAKQVAISDCGPIEEIKRIRVD